MLNGTMLIGRQEIVGTSEAVIGIDPATLERLDPAFAGASSEQVAEACRLAEAALDPYRALPLEKRAAFLEAIADAIMAIGDPLIERVMRETGLPRPRVEGERGRTCGQLRLFAATVRDGAFLDVRVDPADPDRKPARRPDLRLRNIPLGPVAVFGASNFPLAFSVAGGDTAAALAAGCPVVAKAHPAHPGTSALVGQAIRDAAAACDMPEGVFSLLYGAGNAVGEALVTDPRIKAVGFTGSRGGGLALMRLAAQRPEPIPVYAEMSSINPVVLLPGALAERGEAIAKAFAASLTLGAGQFCTNPGLVLAIDDPALETFKAAAAAAVGALPALTMLTPGVHAAYTSGVEQVAGHADIALLARGAAETGPTQARAALFETGIDQFLGDEALQAEIFGAASLLVRCPDEAALARVLTALEGQLTIAFHFTDSDLDALRHLLPIAERKAGRILANDFGTGVEVSPAMVHGGPFPATSDGRSTSVGTLAIRRFLRPVSYQDIPTAILPPELA